MLTFSYIFPKHSFFLPIVLPIIFLPLSFLIKFHYTHPVNSFTFHCLHISRLNQFSFSCLSTPSRISVSFLFLPPTFISQRLSAFTSFMSPSVSFYSFFLLCISSVIPPPSSPSLLLHLLPPLHLFPHPSSLPPSLP